MFMEKDVTERLNKFIKAKRLTNRYIADKINMAEATLNNKLNGTRGLDLETLQKILAQFKDLSANWLLRGEGEMLRDNILEDSTNLLKQTIAEDRNSVDIIIKNEIKKAIMENIPAIISAVMQGMNQQMEGQNQIINKQLDMLQDVIKSLATLNTKSDSIQRDVIKLTRKVG